MKKAKIEKMKVSELVFDADLYPRKSGLNDMNVRAIMDAIQVSVNLPPPIVDQKSKRVVDGNHRVAAWKKMYGEDRIIEVELRSYANDQEMFQAAMELNATHGMKLSSYDKAHCLTVAERLGLNVAVIAAALKMPAGKLGKMMTEKLAVMERVQRAESKTPAQPKGKSKESSPRKEAESSVDTKGQHVPLKRSVRHLAGKEVTENQIKGIEEDAGTSQIWRVNQIIHLFERDLLDIENPKLVAALRQLRDLLNACEQLGDNKKRSVARAG